MTTEPACKCRSAFTHHLYRWTYGRVLCVIGRMQPENGLFIPPFKGKEDCEDHMLLDLIPFLQGEYLDAHILAL